MFLRFVNQEVFILGGDSEEHMQFWENLIVPHLNKAIVKRMSRTTASMIKYTHNAWLALGLVPTGGRVVRSIIRHMRRQLKQIDRSWGLESGACGGLYSH